VALVSLCLDVRRHQMAANRSIATGITFNLYGHLMPGNEQEAARLLDAYLRRSTRDAGKNAGTIGAQNAYRGIHR